MTVNIPDECMFNAKEPAACEWYFTGLGLLADLMISCMSEALPERATAAHYGDSMVAAFFSVDPGRGQWIAIEPTAGGWGARSDGDGESALINLVNGGFRNILRGGLRDQVSRSGGGILAAARFRRRGTLEGRLRCRAGIQIARGLLRSAVVRAVEVPGVGLARRVVRARSGQQDHVPGRQSGKAVENEGAGVSGRHRHRYADGRRRRIRQSESQTDAGCAVGCPIGLRVARSGLDGIRRQASPGLVGGHVRNRTSDFELGASP